MKKGEDRSVSNVNITQASMRTTYACLKYRKYPRYDILLVLVQNHPVEQETAVHGRPMHGRTVPRKKRTSLIRGLRVCIPHKERTMVAKSVCIIYCIIQSKKKPICCRVVVRELSSCRLSLVAVVGVRSWIAYYIAVL